MDKNLLVRAMTASQSDPFRHHPSTLAMFQASILEAYRSMRGNAARVVLFRVPRIEGLGELLVCRNYARLKVEREIFLWDLY